MKEEGERWAEMSSYVSSSPLWHVENVTGNNCFENAFVTKEAMRTAARIPKPHLTGQLSSLLLCKVATIPWRSAQQLFTYRLVGHF